jgi:SPP1 family predicted phage head-tail adaptor
MSMRAGPLDQRITFDAPVPTQAANGEELIAWTPVLAVWASVGPIVGRERLLGDQVLADMDTRVRVRWSSEVAAITPKHRIRHRGQVLNIVSIVNVDSAMLVAEIMCQSGTNPG